MKKTSYLPNFYNQSLALLTDLYQLTMAYGYWKMGMKDRESVFHFSFRRAPFHGGFTIAAGLESLIGYIESFHFDESDLSYLSTLQGVDGSALFPKEFLSYLSKLKLTCDLDAVPEGTIVFPYEPIVRVQGPLIQAQLLESPLLNLLNFPTLIATKAARVYIAAQGDEVLEFGIRRAQGIDGAITASRAAYIGGCHATSHLLAGKLFGIPVKGTHSHAWVMAFDEEIDSFKAFAEAMPNNCVFLVDTYNSIAGIKKAIEVGKWLKEKGKSFLGIRLDSGDLTYLSVTGRHMLDEAGFPDTKIMASNELDETLIADLKRQGAKIAVWGVGTNLVTGKEHPALDGVYKLSAIKNSNGKWKDTLKLSEQIAKISSPGILQIRRFSNEFGPVADMIYNLETGPDHAQTIVDPVDPTRERQIEKNWKKQDLLIPILRKGETIYSLPSLQEIRNNTLKNLGELHPAFKRFINPHAYVVGMEKSLYDTRTQLIRKIRNKTKEK